jgi:hypothetical protein
MMLL